MNIVFKTELKQNYENEQHISHPSRRAKSRSKGIQKVPFHDITHTIPELQINLPILRRKQHLPKDERKLIHKHFSDVRDYNMENWLLTTKKFPASRWDIKQKRTLWKLFTSIDEDGSGEVDIDELADPLLSSGIAKTMGEVRALIRSVDEDNSGSIGFNEFLSIMKPKPNKNESACASGDTNTKYYPMKKKGKVSHRYYKTKIKDKTENNCNCVISQKKESKWSKIVEKKPHTHKLKPIRTQIPVNQKAAERKSDKQRHILGTGLPNNPIIRLQQMQQQNGDMDMKSVLTIKRRKLLLDATMGEAQRRESALDVMGMWKLELKKLNGTAKFKKLYEIQDLSQKLAKTFDEKQHFVSAMQGMIEKEIGLPEKLDESNIRINANRRLSFWSPVDQDQHQPTPLPPIMQQKHDSNVKLLEDTIKKKNELGKGRQALLLPITSRNYYTPSDKNSKVQEKSLKDEMNVNERIFLNHY